MRGNGKETTLLVPQDLLLTTQLTVTCWVLHAPGIGLSTDIFYQPCTLEVCSILVPLGRQPSYAGSGWTRVCYFTLILTNLLMDCYTNACPFCVRLLARRCRDGRGGEGQKKKMIQKRDPGDFIHRLWRPQSERWHMHQKIILVWVGDAKGWSLCFQPSTEQETLSE